MRRSIVLVACVAVLATGCGVSTQDEPEPLVTSSTAPQPVPTLTQRPDPPSSAPSEPTSSSAAPDSTALDE
ncbi:hypothetical protein [Umezawaea sp. Da 62-37]|uniref:hypothetical protein n=1 Tax=Umezawaea sp. Da 62-37 TaxID=3075927 RepID=UPI0028F6EDF2|nr:hypothetical protein [Umezawaea sp. Da 62-37]WNV85163.1 hypothetical protein RM788_44690 [Umezawaea sp. Da 62-37]